mmetsp:Transcript_84374/g.251487  ORF Transcript_84374/g.251487 Transcript_84374/m.251487 type:complete len:293 (+) Transcript_84374:209-1087(+)
MALRPLARAPCGQCPALARARCGRRPRSPCGTGPRGKPSRRRRNQTRRTTFPRRVRRALAPRGARMPMSRTPTAPRHPVRKATKLRAHLLEGHPSRRWTRQRTATPTGKSLRARATPRRGGGRAARVTPRRGAVTWMGRGPPLAWRPATWAARAPASGLASPPRAFHPGEAPRTRPHSHDAGAGAGATAGRRTGRRRGTGRRRTRMRPGRRTAERRVARSPRRRPPVCRPPGRPRAREASAARRWGRGLPARRSPQVAKTSQHQRRLQLPRQKTEAMPLTATRGPWAKRSRP